MKCKQITDIPLFMYPIVHTSTLHLTLEMMIVPRYLKQVK